MSTPKKKPPCVCGHAWSSHCHTENCCGKTGGYCEDRSCWESAVSCVGYRPASGEEGREMNETKPPTAARPTCKHPLQVHGLPTAPDPGQAGGSVMTLYGDCLQHLAARQNDNDCPVCLRAALAALRARVEDFEADRCENGHHTHAECTEACSCVGQGKSELEDAEARAEKMDAALETIRIGHYACNTANGCGAQSIAIDADGKGDEMSERLEPRGMPCPFCGSPAVIQPWHGGKRKRMIRCAYDACYVSPQVTGATAVEAIARWNHRGDDVRRAGKGKP